jgi:hypothetical protein
MLAHSASINTLRDVHTDCNLDMMATIDRATLPDAAVNSLLPEQVQGSTGLIDLLPVSRGYARKLQAILIILTGTNDSFQPHNRGGVGQPKLQFKNFSYLQYRSDHSADASAAQINDAALNHAASIVHRAYNQTGVKLESRRSPPVRMSARLRQVCSHSSSLSAHDRLLSGLHQQLGHLENTLMKCSGE